MGAEGRRPILPVIWRDVCANVSSVALIQLPGGWLQITMTKGVRGTWKRELGWRQSPGATAEDPGCLMGTLGGIVEGLGGVIAPLEVTMWSGWGERAPVTAWNGERDKGGVG